FISRKEDRIQRSKASVLAVMTARPSVFDGAAYRVSARPSASPVYGERRGLLDFSQRDRGAHLSDARQLQQEFLEEPVIVGNVPRDDAEREIGVARRRVAVEHFRAAADLLLDFGDDLGVLPVDGDMDEGADGETRRFPVAHRVIA